MDIATLLARVDHPGYPTVASFLEDVALIPKGMEERWRDDPEGLQLCSKSRALQDAVHSELELRLSPELRTATDEIAARGGPARHPARLVSPSSGSLAMAAHGNLFEGTNFQGFLPVGQCALNISRLSLELRAVPAALLLTGFHQGLSPIRVLKKWSPCPQPCITCMALEFTSQQIAGCFPGFPVRRLSKR